MNIGFEKYHGTGNDFILIDNRHEIMSDAPALISHLCDRHLGIGADGLILLGEAAGYDFSMRYFNADGRESTMCGNGGRCITAYAARLGLITKKAFFTAPDGEHRAELISRSAKDYHIRLEMHDVETAEWEGDSIFLDTGSPHYILLAKHITAVDVDKLGREYRNSDRFAPVGGTNVNFVEAKNGILHIRTYERGVEAETLSCGTGVTASALAWAIREGGASPVRAETRGGSLSVHFERKGHIYQNIWLEGPARHVFSGQIDTNYHDDIRKY